MRGNARRKGRAWRGAEGRRGAGHGVVSPAPHGTAGSPARPSRRHCLAWLSPSPGQVLARGAGRGRAVRVVEQVQPSASASSGETSPPSSLAGRPRDAHVPARQPWAHQGRGQLCPGLRPDPDCRPSRGAAGRGNGSWGSQKCWAPGRTLLFHVAALVQGAHSTQWSTPTLTLPLALV